VIPAFGLPALNTLLLLSSATVVTWAHWGLKKNNRRQLNTGLLITILLGLVFYACRLMNTQKRIRIFIDLYSGIYGTTFFMLTGFHAAHVTLGLTM